MSSDDKISRRAFLEKSGKAVGAVAAAPVLLGAAGAVPVMPHRTLGRTGVSVSILAMGCGSRFLAYPADQATAVLEKAVLARVPRGTEELNLKALRAGLALAGAKPAESC